MSQGVVSASPAVSKTQVVELASGDTYDLVADEVTKVINGVEHTMLAYNGSIPGPTIRVQQGSEVTINFTNNTSMRTLLHSHGVRMDNPFDGAHTSQMEMESGETFAYKLKFPDAGVYWYHPHVREDYQQELGMYGAFIVEPAEPDYLPLVNREEVLFLDDILVEGGDINLSESGADHTLMGRFGNVMLVNGQEDYVLEARRDEVVRLYIINSANVRPFNFAIKGAKMKLVGADNGAYERATFVDAVTLGPSERAIVDVLITEPGTLINDTPAGLTLLGSIAVTDGPLEKSYAAEFNTLQASALTSASIDPFRQYFAAAPDKKIALTVDMMGMGGHMMPDGTMMGGMMGGVPEGGIEWEDDMAMMNSMATTDSVQWHIVDQAGKRDMDIDWAFKKGEPVKIRIFNDPESMHPMQHPIHFHGQRFLVVTRDGVPQTNLVWKDTVLVKAGETVDIVLDTSNPGLWMAHCHIAEHLESGMMFTYRVE